MPNRFLAVLLLAAAPAFAQRESHVVAVSPEETVSETPVRVRVDLGAGSEVDRVLFVYRPGLSSDVRRLEMDLVGNTAFAVIPAADVQPPFLEYQLVLTLRTGEVETYPLSAAPNPLEAPPTDTRRIMVRPVPKDDGQILFLSPEPMSRVSPDDLLISVSLLRADSTAQPEATRIFLDGTDITDRAVMSGDLLVVPPGAAGIPLVPGKHTVTVRLVNSTGEVYRSAALDFYVAGTGADAVEAAPPQAQLPAGPFYRGSVMLESRNESIGGATTWYNRGGLNGSATYGDWTALGNLFITSDEDPDRQPQNRYYVGVTSPWLSAGYGDSYPLLSNLILSGKRVRGPHASLRLGAFNLDAVAGSTLRGLEGNVLKTFAAESLDVERSRDPGASYATLEDGSAVRYVPGTYERDLIAIRPSFGSGETWQLGLTALQGKDDESSIRFGIRPQENIVVGTDLVTRLDNGGVEFRAEAAFSVFNSDITGGTMTDAYIDSASIFEGREEDVKRAKDILGRFITFNENVRPLALDQPSTSSWNADLTLNYLSQSLTLGYLYRGSDYVSFGQSFLRTDIQGFHIGDRARLADNSVFLTVNYERLEDNTSGTKVATTAFSSINVSAQYLPRSGSTTLTASYGYFDSDNDIGNADPDSLRRMLAIDEGSNRVFLQAGQGFDYLDARHTATFTASWSDRNDRTSRNMDTRTTLLGLRVLSSFTMQLQTTAEITATFNAYPIEGGGLRDLNYTILLAGARWTTLEGKLFVNASVAPWFGDIRRTVLDAGAEYRFLPTLGLRMDYSLYVNSGIPNDGIWNLRMTYDI